MNRVTDPGSRKGTPKEKLNELDAYNWCDLRGGRPIFKLRRRVSVPRDQAEALLQIELVPITVIIMWQFEMMMMMKRILLIRLLTCWQLKLPLL